MFVLDERSAVALLADAPRNGGGLTDACELGGGFMNMVLRVQGAGERSVVLKQALPYIRAFPEIQITPDRLGFEHAALAYLAAGPPLPGADLPQPLWFDAERHVLAMTDLGTGRRLEDALIAGEVDAGVARNLGRFLAALHSTTADKPELAAQFQNDAMHQLRLEHCFFGFCEDPAVVPHIEALARAFTEHKYVLLHGDFWTASVLVDRDPPGVYDLEFCNYGDPAQDVGFMLAHYLLHFYNTPAVAPAVRAAVDAFWQAYQGGVTYAQDAGFARRAVQQIGVEMLFRVSGLNTVAYVQAADRKAAIVEAATRCIVDPQCTLETLWS